jgi:hypothetical protein
MGAISTGQTNPDEPDYFPPFLYQKLIQVGLVAHIQTTNLPEERGYRSFNDWARDTDNINKVPSLDYLKKAYIAKKGVNALVSKDGHRETKRRTL